MLLRVTVADSKVNQIKPCSLQTLQTLQYNSMHVLCPAAVHISMTETFTGDLGVSGGAWHRIELTAFV